jgi:hypothetical protein
MKSAVGEKMLIITTHLPKPIVQMLDRLVEDGVYPNRAEAIRTILSIYVPETLTKYGLVHGGQEGLVIPSSDSSASKDKSLLVSFKMTRAQYDLMRLMAEKTGIQNKSKLLRMSLDFYFRNHFSRYYL